MNTKIFYKLCKKVGNNYYSQMIQYLYPKYCIEYQLGKWSKPNIGLLFVYGDKKSMINNLTYRYKSSLSIFECRIGEVRIRPKSRLATYNLASPARLDTFWSRELYNSTELSDIDFPNIEKLNYVLTDRIYLKKEITLPYD